METLKSASGGVVQFGCEVVGLHAYQTKNRRIRKLVVSPTGNVVGMAKNGSKISLFIEQ